MKKRWTALVLTLSMVCAMALPAHAAEKVYPDTTGHYAADAINTWSEYGVLEGYLDGSFRPDGKITRAEMATVVVRVMGYRNKAENTFTDLPTGQWYTDYLLRAAAEGVFKGNPDRTMKPNEPITRQEAFAALSRVLNMAESEKATGFKDDSSIADWARGYVSAMKEAGYIQGDQKGNIRAGEPITRAEVVTILNKMAKAFVNEDGTYSQDCRGNLIINAQDVTLKDMTIEGDLIVADGVGDGDVYLDKVTVKGDVILRGCGENSFHILPGTKVENIIVTKTTSGAIRLVNESGQPIPMVWVNDGSSGVILEGDELGNVVIACDVPVTIASKKVQTVSVTGNAKVTVEKGSTIAKVDLAKTATKASLTVEGKVTAMTNDAKIKVEKPNGGSVGSGSSSSGGGSGSSGGSSSSGGGSGSGGGSDTPAPSTPTTVSEVTLMLLAPAFGNKMDKADVLGVGYTAETKWLNADGSGPSCRWKADGAAEDTFTANQAYKAVVTLSPVSGYVFADDLKVKVTDGKLPATEYIPAKSEKSGNNWVVTMEYEKTAEKEYVESVSVSGSTDLLVGETGTLSAGYTDNYLIDPATHTYRWYQCDDGSKTNQREVAAGKEYTIPADDMTAAVDDEKDLYYFVEVTAGGKTYPSGVATVTVEEPLDVSKIGKPVFREELYRDDERWYYGGAGYTVYLDEVIKHKALGYNLKITYIGTIETMDGTVESIESYDGDVPWSNGAWISKSDIYRTEDSTWGRENIAHDMKYFIQRQMNEEYRDYYGPEETEVRTITITGIKIEAVPQVYYGYEDSRNQVLEELKVEKTYDISNQPIIYHLVRSTDDLEQWDQNARDGYPLEGTYRYTVNQIDDDEDNWSDFEIVLQRKDGDEWVENITRFTDELQEEIETNGQKWMVNDYYLIFAFADLLRPNETIPYSTDTWFQWYSDDDKMEEWEWYGGLSSYDDVTMTRVDTYLIYKPTAGYESPNVYEYYYYRMDNTNAEILQGNS